MYKEKKIILIAGLPRSGSTLLCNILAQNPMFHVTPTNGMLQLLQMIKNNWTDIDSFKAQGIDKTLPKVRKALRGMLESFYEEYFDKDMIVFDKDRGWLNHIDLLEEITGRKVQVITTIRDIKDIAASFEKLNRKNTMLKNNLYSNDIARLSIYSRTSDLLSPTGVIGNVVNMLRDVFQKELSDRLLIIPMGALTNDPKFTMEDLHKALDLEPFEYHFTDMKQLVIEDDFVYGIEGLHTIQKDVKPVESSAMELLGEQICSEINEQFKDIKKLLG